MRFLDTKSKLEITSTLPQSENLSIKLAIIDIQNSLKLENVNNNLCVFQYKNNDLVIKSYCAIIAQFNAAINITTEKMDAADIFELANTLMDHTHDRIEDFILCLKMAKRGDFGKIYNRVDGMVILDFWKQYMDLKAVTMESQYKENKSQMEHTRNEIDSILISNERIFETQKEKQIRLERAERFQARTFNDNLQNFIEK